MARAQYRLRWCFEFATKAPRRGVWDSVSSHPRDSAWGVPKDGLIRASIEGEGLQGTPNQDKVVRLFECYGQDFVASQAEGYARVPGSGFKGPKFTPKTHVYALVFITRGEYVSVRRDGLVTRRPLTEEEKRFDFHEHSAGA